MGVSQCLPCLMILFFAACTTSGVEPAQANLAGVPEWHLSAEPIATIGGDDQRPGYRLTQVRDARFVDDGGVVLLDPSDGGVGFYSPDGSLRRMNSGRGDGPGEFRNPRSVSLDGEGDVHVWDSQLRRFSKLRPDGTFLSSSVVAGRGTLGLGIPIVGLTDGSAWTQQGTPGQRPDGAARRPFSIIRLDPVTWANLGVLAVMPDKDMFTKSDGTTRGTTPVIFGRRSVFTGRLDLLVGDTGTLVFYVINNLGDTVRTIEHPWDPVNVPEGTFEAVRSAEITRAEGKRAVGAVPAAIVSDFKKRELLALSAVPGRETFPAWQNYFQSRDGTIWIELFTIPDSPFTRTLVLSRTGDALGTLELPVDAKILDALEGRILVLTKNEWDVPTLSVLQVESSPEVHGG